MKDIIRLFAPMALIIILTPIYIFFLAGFSHLILIAINWLFDLIPSLGVAPFSIGITHILMLMVVISIILRPSSKIDGNTIDWFKSITGRQAEKIENIDKNLSEIEYVQKNIEAATLDMRGEMHRLDIGTDDGIMSKS